MDAPRAPRRTAPFQRRPRGSPAADKYGPRRLGALYEVGKLLTHFIETVEQTVLTLLAIVTREIPLRTVVLIEKTDSRPKAIVWRSPGISARDLRATEGRAMKAFAYLTDSDVPPTVVKEAGAGSLTASPGEALTGEARGKFLTCPLVAPGRGLFGVLHLEGSSAFEEADLAFVSAIADQLAISLDRYYARLDEIVLRRQGDVSRRLVERELARRKRVEEEVRRLNADLERRVAERTSQFEDTIKELHAFTYSIAHDLRAPLRHVHGFSRRLLSTASDEECRDYARRIMATSAGMDIMIKDLLAYSRLTLDEVKCEPIPLSPVLARVKAAMPELRERKVHFEVREPLPTVMGHEPSLAQALTNLIANAVKFAAAGVPPRVLVRAELLGSHARLWVEDNGIGIAPEHQERIFGVFQRLHKAEEYPGTGIGLAIVRRTMERMRGSAGVVSALGQGSRFWIELEKAEG